MKEQEEESDSNKSEKYPLPYMEEEEWSKQGGVDLESTPFEVKQNREQEKEGLRKKSKATKSSLDLITSTEHDLEDLMGKVRDAME